MVRTSNAEPHILIVEDNISIARSTSRFLASNGFRISHASDAVSMDRIIRDAHIDLVLLDLLLPGEGGLSICRRLRGDHDFPIIILTALGEEADRVIGLELGADDYLSKPYSVSELLARIRAVMRRSKHWVGLGASRHASLSFGGWKIDSASRQLHNPDGVRIALTAAEFDLLFAFCEHPRRILNRDQLLDLTQGRSSGVFDRSVDMLVSRLRRKLEVEPREPELIKTVRSGGYIFTSEVRSV